MCSRSFPKLILARNNVVIHPSNSLMDLISVFMFDVMGQHLRSCHKNSSYFKRKKGNRPHNAFIMVHYTFEMSCIFKKTVPRDWNIPLIKF